MCGAGAAASTDVLRYLVAEDFFAAAGEETRAMMPAVVAAVKVRRRARLLLLLPRHVQQGGLASRQAPLGPLKACMLLSHRAAAATRVQRWAGPDQAQALSLCEWLYHRVASLAAFMPDRKKEDAAAGERHRHPRPLRLHHPCCSGCFHLTTVSPLLNLFSSTPAPRFLQEWRSSSGRSKCCRRWQPRPRWCGSGSLCRRMAPGWRRTRASWSPRWCCTGRRHSW